MATPGVIEELDEVVIVGELGVEAEGKVVSSPSVSQVASTQYELPTLKLVQSVPMEGFYF